MTAIHVRNYKFSSSFILFWYPDLISIIIVNWNGKKFLSECLDGLRQQVYHPLSVTLVDNGSDDGSIDFVAGNYPEVNTIALPRNLGFSAANNKNIGVRSSFLTDRPF